MDRRKLITHARTRNARTHAQFTNFIKNTNFAKSSLQNNIILHFYTKIFAYIKKKQYLCSKFKIKININN